MPHLTLQTQELPTCETTASSSSPDSSHCVSLPLVHAVTEGSTLMLQMMNTFCSLCVREGNGYTSRPIWT